jgi:hypothetical protein
VSFLYVTHLLVIVNQSLSRKLDWLTYDNVSVMTQTFLLIYPFLEVLLCHDKIEVLIHNIDYFPTDGTFISNNFVDYLFANNFFFEANSDKHSAVRINEVTKQ